VRISVANSSRRDLLERGGNISANPRVAANSRLAKAEDDLTRVEEFSHSVVIANRVEKI
jgi:hypothetical protein